MNQFKCLGAILGEEGSKTKVLVRAAQTTATQAKLKPMWRDKTISLSSMLKLLHASVLSVFSCACETWALTEELQMKIQGVEIRCFRRVLGISYTEHIRNEEMRAVIVKHVKLHRRAADQHEEKKTTLVLARDKSQWPIEDHPPRYHSRWKMKGQTEK